MTPPDRLTVWKPSEMLGFALDPVLRSSLGVLPASLRPNDVLETGIQAKSSTVRVSALSSLSSEPHVDETFAPWSILWILAAGQNQTLGSADIYRPNGGRLNPVDTTKGVEIAIVAGDLVSLSLHHVHWLNAAEDGGAFHAIAVESDTWLDASAAEAKILTLLKNGHIL